jgi:hypothetical protein
MVGIVLFPEANAAYNPPFLSIIAFIATGILALVK